MELVWLVGVAGHFNFNFILVFNILDMVIRHEMIIGSFAICASLAIISYNPSNIFEISLNMSCDRIFPS